MKYFILGLISMTFSTFAFDTTTTLYLIEETLELNKLCSEDILDESDMKAFNEMYCSLKASQSQDESQACEKAPITVGHVYEDSVALINSSTEKSCSLNIFSSLDQVACVYAVCR